MGQSEQPEPFDRDEHLTFIAEQFDKDQPLLSTVLKGHLLIEDCLERAMRELMPNFELIEQARLSFHQKQLITRSISAAFDNGDERKIWTLISKYNKLRNQLAHNLNAETNNKVRDLLHAMRSLLIEIHPDNRDSLTQVEEHIGDQDVAIAQIAAVMVLGELADLVEALQTLPTS